MGSSTRARVARRVVLGTLVGGVLLTGVGIGAAQPTEDTQPSTPSTAPEVTTTTAVPTTTAPPATVPSTTAPTASSTTTTAPGVPGATGGDVGTEVVGGKVVPSDASFPFVAAIFLSNGNPYFTQFCGATLVARYWLVTAASCVAGARPSQLQVALRKKSLSTIRAADRRAIDKIVVYNFFTGTGQHDIALLRLASPVPTSVAAPMRLIPHPAYAGQGTPAWTLGWGATNSAGTSFPNTLRYGAVNIFSSYTSPTCGSWTAGHGYKAGRMLCAGAPYPTGGTVASCVIDNGGPLYIKIGSTRYLAGVMFGSLFEDCANADGFVPLYTRVSTYASWIRAWIKTRP